MLFSATYEIELDAPLQFADILTQMQESVDGEEDGTDIFPTRAAPQVQLTVDGCSVTITFNHEFLVDNPLMTGHYAPGVKRLTIELAHDFQNLDSEPSSCKRQIVERFRLVIWSVMDGRVLPYFKHIRGMPFLRPFNAGNVRGVSYRDSSGNDVFERETKGTIFAEYPGRPGKGATLGCSAVRPSELDDLRDQLESPPHFTVVDELRSQAREAIFEKNILLAVLLLAVSTEVAVKRTFFEPRSMTSSAFSYLAETKKLSMTEYLTGVCDTVFGIGFNKAHPVDYTNVDHLFRCRNKIAHAGKAEFKDVRNEIVEVSAPVFGEWWDSVDVLFAWLDQRVRERAD